MIKLNRVSAIAGKQAGLITRRQLVNLGYTRWQIQWALDTSALEIEVRNVYRLAGAPWSPDLELWRAVLWAGPGTFISHVTAGWVWGLDGVGFRRPKAIDIIVAANRVLRPPKQIEVHRGRGFKPGKHTEIKNGIPVTSLERTLVDLSGVLTPLDLDKAVDSATRRHPKIKQTTSELMDTLTPRGRRGYHALRKLVDDPASLGATGSGLEVVVRDVIREEGIREPLPQLQICDDTGEQIGIFDFAWPESMVVLLVHSKQWHSNWNQVEKDHDQRDRLEAEGWRVLTITSRRLKAGRGRFVAHLKAALAKGRARSV